MQPIHTNNNTLNPSSITMPWKLDNRPCNRPDAQTSEIVQSNPAIRNFVSSIARTQPSFQTNLGLLMLETPPRNCPIVLYRVDDSVALGNQLLQLPNALLAAGMHGLQVFVLPDALLAVLVGRLKLRQFPDALLVLGVLGLPLLEFGSLLVAVLLEGLELSLQASQVVVVALPRGPLALPPCSSSARAPIRARPAASGTGSGWRRQGREPSFVGLAIPPPDSRGIGAVPSRTSEMPAGLRLRPRILCLR